MEPVEVNTVSKCSVSDEKLIDASELVINEVLEHEATTTTNNKNGTRFRKNFIFSKVK